MSSTWAQLETPFETRALSETLGVEVLGLDLEAAPLDAVMPTIVDLFNHAGVVVLRGQELTPETLIAFSRCFGVLEPHTDPEHLLPGHPEIMLIGNVAVDGVRAFYHNVREEWHTDLIQTHTPNAATVLYAIESPAVGAETRFADAQGAYEALPSIMQERLRGFTGVYDFRTFDAAMRAQDPDREPLSEQKLARHPTARHPLVRTHPATGKRSLYFAPEIITGIDGLSHEQSRALIDELLAHLTQERFVYAHRWRDGDVVIWDNRCTLHTATPFDGIRYRRLLWRTVIAGEVPV
jgi:taurine dioxygenase